ncbi:Putative aliphatic sulfonates-binding protein precursor [Lacunisphaera limnophila]|uniref:Aliphatic sulfonates-binding protein n=1 Tax=Lacunisphaera limnophila TaxID=1838286 RepID=A0A1D8AZ43_9BACT|nr:NrtA/SsuA/CpmA family ABC transporter substrate-binding protein [Lacunisphaera limnophila]AOS46141.1 Putative aliphatic sulfonates-binding protein precursor [Lacunisphaera limnophila]
MKKLSHSLLAITLWLGSAWQAFGQQALPADSQPPVSIKVAYAPVVLNVPLFLGQTQGLFKSNGIEVEAKLFTSANEMINALVANQVDAVTGVSMVPILNLEAQFPGRVRIILHSKMSEASPYDSIVTRADSALKKLDDLKGHKVGLYPGTTALNLLKAFLKSRGIDPASVELIQLPPSSHISALQSGAIDALFAYEPTLTALLKQKEYRKLFGSVYVAMLEPSPISCSVISRKFETEHPEAAKRFSETLGQAVLLARNDPAGARNSLSGFTKLAPEVIPHVNLVADVLPTETDLKNVQQFSDLMREIGELPKSVDAAALLAPTK